MRSIKTAHRGGHAPRSRSPKRSCQRGDTTTRTTRHVYTQLFRKCQVSNAVQQPLSQFSHEEIKKNSVIALYANEKEDNNGLPFFLGKVLRVFNKNEKDDDDDEDDKESDEAPEYLVEIHEYIQTEIHGQPTGNTYFITSMGRKKRIREPQQPRRPVTSKVELGQIAFLIDKMNKDKSLPNPTMKTLSFNCEVAARREIFKCPGWRKVVLDLGPGVVPATTQTATPFPARCSRPWPLPLA